MEFNNLRHIVRFAILIGIQITILNQIHFSGYITPYIYPLFILLLPFDIKGYSLLLTAFFTGITIDLFTDSLGMHTSASLIMAFLRPSVINLISIKTDFDAGTEPRINVMGTGWVFLYTLILVFIHHLSLFLIEVFRFKEIFETLSRAVLSTGFSLVVIMIAHFFMGTKTRGRNTR